MTSSPRCRGFPRGWGWTSERIHGWPANRDTGVPGGATVTAMKAMNALCCECGNLRTCKRPRNRAYGHRIDGSERATGDLKCSACNRVTRHAVLSVAAVEYRDMFEADDAVARGTPPGPDTWLGTNPRALDDLRDLYRRAQPQNPYLSHIWCKSDADGARERGETTVRAYCGVRVPLPKNGGRDLTEKDYKPVAQTEEYEGPDGEFWVDMDCVDCARVVNDRRRWRRARQVADWLPWVTARVLNGSLPAEDVDELYRALEVIVDRFHQRKANRRSS